MKKSEVTKLITDIDSYYRGRMITEDPTDLINSWYEALKDEDTAKVNANLIRHVKTSRYIPTISELVHTPDERMRTVPDVEATRQYLMEQERRAAEPKDLEAIEQEKKKIRAMLEASVKKGE